MVYSVKIVERKYSLANSDEINFKTQVYFWEGWYLFYRDKTILLLEYYRDIKNWR